MKMLALTRYGRLGASSRLRTYQYLPLYRRAGIDVECSPVLSDRYVRRLYAGKGSPGEVARGYAQRAWTLAGSGKYDLVWIEKEALPWVPFAIEDSLIPRKSRIVLDYDDAIFHRYDGHRSPIVRSLLGEKLGMLMSRARLVVAGNPYLAAYASRHSANVEIVPTVIDLDRYPDGGHGGDPPRPVTVGWIGSPSTAHYLKMVYEPLRELKARHGIRCIAVGARADQLSGGPFERVAWTEEGEVASIRGFDIGIMPLLDTPWELGKCAYKIVQYMGCGLPVVASDVGANASVVDDGVSGYLARWPEDWYSSLERLILDPGRRDRFGAQGRSIVERRYSLQSQGERLVSLLENVARGE